LSDIKGSSILAYGKIVKRNAAHRENEHMSLAVKENVGRSGDLERVISNLTAGVYSFGSLSGAVLHELDKLARSLGDNCRSLETGCGRSTIMFSNLARRHLCFCFDDRNAQLPAGRDDNFGTVSFVQANPHFNKDCVTFVFGPTQKTVPNYDFRDVSLDFVFLDGINIPTLANFFRFLRDDANVETDFRSRKYGLL
jgi:hypothetical protein